MPPSAAVLPLLALLAGCLSASSAAAPPPEPFGVTPLMLSRALLSNGSAENWQSVHARLASGRCVKVVTIGGSNTCTSAPPSGPSYWDGLGVELNNRYPCTGSVLGNYGQVLQNTHASVGLCAHGKGTQHWLGVLSQVLANVASDTTATHPNWFSALTQHEISEFHLLSADLLLVETSINDGPVCFGQGCWEALWPETQKVAHAHTELLIRLVRALPHPPSIMYVGLRWKGAYWVEAANKTLLPVWRGESYPRKCDGVYAQLAVTHPLGVAHVSPWDGLLAAAPPPDDEWFASTYAIKGDLAHMTAYGYATARSFVAGAIASLTASLASVDATNPPPEQPLLFVSAHRLHVALTSTPLVVDLGAAAMTALRSVELHQAAVSSLAEPSRWEPRVVASEGWELVPDSKGKLGLAGKGVGASLELLFDAGDIIAHDRFHTLRLEAVHSYEHMGTFSVAVAAVEATLLAPPKTDGGLPEWKCSPWPAAGELVGTVQADCLWEMRQSTVEVTDVVFAQPNNNSCLRVLVRVVESAPARVENAVKLVAVTLF